MLDLGSGKGELCGQVAVAAAELRVPCGEPVVLGRAASGGGRGGPVTGDLPGDLGVAAAEGGVRQSEAAGQHGAV
ncbi:hypothetical protein [Streptomyces sp. NPDC029704]|uniref:hypothetical protein n=1 Tax=Streptomyces sp. NPDC029704 TaxID=3156920 RepID=UPI0033D940F5